MPKDNEKEKTLNQKIREQVLKHMKLVDEDSDELYGRWAARREKLDKIRGRYTK